jgi:hypothetical protein
MANGKAIVGKEIEKQSTVCSQVEKTLLRLFALWREDCYILRFQSLLVIEALLKAL